MKRQARRLFGEAARFAAALTRGDGNGAEIERLHGEAQRLRQKTKEIQMNLERAFSHPATQYTLEASGAEGDEPPHIFPRALPMVLREMDVSPEMVNWLTNTGKGKGKGQKQ